MNNGICFLSLGIDAEHFCTLNLGLGVTKENPTQSGIRTAWNNALFTERRDGKITFSIGLSTPQWPTGSSQQPTQGGGLHIPILCCNGRPWSLPTKDKYHTGVVKCHMTPTLRQNKGTHSGSETRWDNPTQGNKFNTNCVGSLSLDEEVFQARGPFLCRW